MAKADDARTARNISKAVKAFSESQSKEAGPSKAARLRAAQAGYDAAKAAGTLPSPPPRTPPGTRVPVVVVKPTTPSGFGFGSADAEKRLSDAIKQAGRPLTGNPGTVKITRSAVANFIRKVVSKLPQGVPLSSDALVAQIEKEMAAKGQRAKSGSERTARLRLGQSGFSVPEEWQFNVSTQLWVDPATGNVMHVGLDGRAQIVGRQGEVDWEKVQKAKESEQQVLSQLMKRELPDILRELVEAAQSKLATTSGGRSK
jgi:hypothetical protein